MKRSVSLALLFSVTLVGGAARAETAEQILKLADEAFNAFKDLTIESTMIIKEPGAATGREVSMITESKGDKRLVRFVAPGDVKGMGFLTEGRDVMYALLPAFGNRVRRMGTHVKNQGFMGSDASFEDMSETKMSNTWSPKLVGEDAASFILELTPLPGHETEFPKEKVWIDKKLHQGTRIEYIDAAGKVQKLQLRTDWHLDPPSAHYTPEWIRITDHRRNDHMTEIHNTKTTADRNLSEDEFSQRSLVRGQ